ncbi:MAG: hypothetical protein KUG77_25940 [Nannocystaceae bacterium]|nr:hypothetical protein [Nannocystaceae bacterium]
MSRNTSGAGGWRFALVMLHAVGLSCADDDGGEPQGTGDTSTTTTGALTEPSGEQASTTAVASGTSSGTGQERSTGPAASTDEGDTGETTGGEAGCFVRLPAEDRARKVVVGQPYDDAGAQAAGYSVLELSASGELSGPSATFEMRRSVYGPIRFTPDGRVGIAHQSARANVDEGNSFGVFEIDEDGEVQVRDEGFEGSYYPGGFSLSHDGETLWALDSAFRDVGGGVFEVSVGCDGALTEHKQAVSGRLTQTLDFTTDGHALIGAHVYAGADPAADAFLFDWGRSENPIAAADLFGHEDFIIGASALTADERLFALSDVSTFSAAPNRVAFGRVESDALIQDGTIDIFDPFEMVASPFGDIVLVGSGEGNAIYILDYDAGASPALTLRGELSYVGTAPALPGKATMVRHGTLEGLVLWTENTGVRRIQFLGDGEVVDLGLFSLGAGFTAIPGGIGVQP